MRVEIHGSARRHGVPDQDIAHAFEHCIAWIELGDDPRRYLLAGPDKAGNLLELVALVTDSTRLVIHAMPLRATSATTLFGSDR